MTERTRGVVLGLAAAVAFGTSAPLSKRLLGQVEPLMLAGLLYLGAFWVLAGITVARGTQVEARLQRADGPRLAALVVSGGVVAPVLLLLGLERVSGISGALLLNLEGPLTILLGVSLFREHLSRQAAVGAGVVFGGAVILSVEGMNGSVDLVGVLLIAMACLGWALDNNLTQSLTLRDPRTIVLVKTATAGAVNVVLAVALGQAAPAFAVLGGAMVLGAFSYGLSVYWDALALRELGAAREAAIFAVAPFVGALIAPLVLPETFDFQEVAAGVLMAVGIAMLLTEHHVHRHRHEPLLHEHAHDHDAHHQHDHDTAVEAGTRHSHLHRHEPQDHSHAHVSDLHHRHSH